MTGSEETAAGIQRIYQPGRPQGPKSTYSTKKSLKMYPGTTRASPARCARLRVHRSIFRCHRFTIWYVEKKQDEKYYFITEKILLEFFFDENFQNRNFRTKKKRKCQNRKCQMKIFKIENFDFGNFDFFLMEISKIEIFKIEIFIFFQNRFSP